MPPRGTDQGGNFNTLFIRDWLYAADDIKVQDSIYLGGSTGDTTSGSTKIYNDGDSTVIEDSDGSTQSVEPVYQMDFPVTELAGGEYATNVIRIFGGTTLKVIEAGVHTRSGNVPTGVNINVRDATNGTAEFYKEFTSARTGASASNGLSTDWYLECRLENGTTNTHNLTGFIRYKEQ